VIPPVVIPVAVPDHPYEVVVGPGVLSEIPERLGDRRRVAIVSQRAIADLHAGAVLEALPDAELVIIGDGEAAKTLATVEELCSHFAAAGLLRGDAVVALGGGVVGDTAGFAAAVYHRGVDVVQAPTTLLAQVDAAIGGKTAVNLPEGKNLVGAFHQPVAVVADVATLATLPEREYRSGLGEAAKYALMDPESAPTDLEGVADVLARDPALLTVLVAACVGIKAVVVAADPGERTGARATLNYGHTLAHALETSGGYELLHGEAVAIGLVFAAELACALGRIDEAEVARHRAFIERLGLPIRVPDGAHSDEILDAMRRDKKASGGLTFVLRSRDGLDVVDDPPAPALERALHAVGVEG